MRPIVAALLRLTRGNEFTWQVAVTSLMGAAAGHGRLGWPLVAVLIANWLAVGFAFMINDVEDAPDDARDPAKAKRNPVSAGDISPRAARIASYAVAASSAAAYALLGPWPLGLGLACLLLGQLYSWRRVRLKRLPVVDLASHALMLAGLQFLAAMAVYGPPQGARWAFPLAMLLAISMYGELHNEVRDREGDLKAGLKHTGNLLGPTLSRGLMAVCMAIAAGTGTVALLVHQLYPLWVLFCMIGLALLLSAFQAFRAWRARAAFNLEGTFHKPFEMAGAISMSACFVWPWLAARLSLLLLLQRYAERLFS